MQHGLVHLDVSRNNGGKIGMGALTRALRSNTHLSETLTFLDLSLNTLDKDGSTGLAAFLALPNPLRVLVLANTALSVDIVVSAIVRGCNSLELLDISGNRIKAGDGGALSTLLQSAAALRVLNLSRTTLPVRFPLSICNTKDRANILLILSKRLIRLFRC